MASRKPLVLNTGLIQQLQAGDSLDAVANEVDLVSLTNGDGGAIVIGTPVYTKADGTVAKAKADASGTIQVIGVVRDTSIGNGSAGTIQTGGVLVATTDQWDAVTGGAGGLTVGQYYLSAATAGRLTATAPSTASQFVVPLGRALSTTELDLAIQPGVKL